MGTNKCQACTHSIPGYASIGQTSNFVCTSKWEYSNYNAPIDFLFDKKIMEYDISKANISILRDAGKITEDEYQTLFNADRETRQVTIGHKILRDPSIQDALDEGLKEARRIFCNLLRLEDQNILHIVKDSIFVVDNIATTSIWRPDEVKIFNKTKFQLRSSYTNYIRFSPGLYYYHSFDVIQKVARYKIRGMNEVAQSMHERYFIYAINDILTNRQINGYHMAYNCAKRYYQNIANGTAPIEYSRRFDSQSLYDLAISSDFSTFQADYLSEEAQEYVTPEYNLKLLSFLANCLLCDMMQNNR